MLVYRGCTFSDKSKCNQRSSSVDPGHVAQEGQRKLSLSLRNKHQRTFLRVIILFHRGSKVTWDTRLLVWVGSRVPMLPFRSVRVRGKIEESIDFLQKQSDLDRVWELSGVERC